ncbi:MAG: ATP-binding cassette domain-containing protein, partial [Balneolaceae bacterium]
MAELMIKAEKLTRMFGSFTAVDHITFEVGKGEIFGFLGANGAGKTTAMRMLTGLLIPTDGEATVAGQDVYDNPEQIKKQIGYMSQKFSLYEDLTVRENIRLYGGIYGLSDSEIKQKSDDLIAMLDMQELQNKRI